MAKVEEVPLELRIVNYSDDMRDRGNRRTLDFEDLPGHLKGLKYALPKLSIPKTDESKALLGDIREALMQGVRILFKGVYSYEPPDVKAFLGAYLRSKLKSDYRVIGDSAVRSISGEIYISEKRYKVHYSCHKGKHEFSASVVE